MIQHSERSMQQCTSGQITSNILTQESWRLYEIRQPPTSLCIISNRTGQDRTGQAAGSFLNSCDVSKKSPSNLLKAKLLWLLLFCHSPRLPPPFLSLSGFRSLPQPPIRKTWQETAVTAAAKVSSAFSSSSSFHYHRLQPSSLFWSKVQTRTAIEVDRMRDQKP